MSYHAAVDILVDLLEERQAYYSGFRRKVSDLHYMLDFGTVSCNLGRGSGNTSYVLSRATSKDLVVVATMDSKRMYKNSEAKVLTVDEINSPSFRLTSKINNVYVDPCSVIFKHIDKEDLYRCILSQSTVDMFILLG